VSDEPGPPGPAARWETIQREWDKDGRLISEKITTTTETVHNAPPPERRTGFYL
jgi:hypothetical protein